MGNRTFDFNEFENVVHKYFLFEPHPECLFLLEGLSRKYKCTLSETLSKAIGMLDLVSQHSGGSLIIKDEDGNEVIQMDGF